MLPPNRLSIPLLPLLIAISLCSRSNADSISRDTLGIAPQDEGYFKSDVIKCKDGSRKFTRDRLNDDFCDCPDGTDEPGTSACPEGNFYCRNVGHTPVLIFSSRVNDGICDCCDGSDEYNGRVKCTNTCWEAGKVARDRLIKRVATFQEGVTIRSQEVKKAQDAFSKDEDDLSKLKDEEKVLKGLVHKLKEHKDQIEKAEEQERLKREKEEKRIKDLEVKENEEKESEVLDNNEKQTDEEKPEQFNQDKIKGQESSIEHDLVGEHKPFDDPKVNEEGQDDQLSDGESATATRDEGAAHEDSVNSEGLSKEELGRLVASRWTGETVDDEKTDNEKTDNVDTPAKPDEDEQNINFPESVDSEDYDEYNSETDDENDKYDDSDFDDKNTVDEESDEHDHDFVSEERDHPAYTASGSQSWLGKIQEKVQNIFQAINLFKTPLNISEAAHIRKEYDDASSKLSKMQSRISTLTEKLKHDFGKEKEFYLFYNHCFESKQNKYTYKVCPYKQASQVEGHSTTRLGSWDKFEESYRVLQFSNGDRCWNGPDRSLKVRLRCGLKTELTDVDEPSRCEYVAVLSTPLLCLDAKLKELQEKLELLNSEQPFSRDEL